MFEIAMLNQLGLYNSEISLKDLILSIVDNVTREQCGIIGAPLTKYEVSNIINLMERIDDVAGVKVTAQYLPPECAGVAQITYFNKHEYLVIELYQSDEVCVNYKNHTHPNSYAVAYPWSTVDFSDLMIRFLKSMGVRDPSKQIEVLKLGY